MEEKGKVKEVHQWDTFVRGLARVLDADVSSRSKNVDEVEEARIGEKRKRREDDDQPDRSAEPDRLRGSTRRPLVVVLQDAHLLGKNLGTAFESLLRLSKMVSLHISCLLFFDKQPDCEAEINPILRRMQ